MEREADNFFASDEVKPVKKEKKSAELTPIRQEHPQLTRLTAEEEKINKLLNNYE